MNREELRRTLFQHIESLRGRLGPPEPSEIVRAALELGLSRQDALAALTQYGGYQPPSMGRDLPLVPAFIRSLIDASKSFSVLQVVTSQTLLAAYVPEPSAVGTYAFAVDDNQASDTLRALVEGSAAQMYLGRSAAVPADSRWDTIVAQPPLGHRPGGDPHADGFGGEVVGDLALRLADGGTLCWVTARGALHSSRVSATLDGLKASGLSLVGVVELPSGAFQGTTLSGAVFVWRRRSVAKRLVGVLNSIDVAPQLAAALVSGPSRKGGPGWTWLEPDDARTFTDLEHERLQKQLQPRGRYEMAQLGSLLDSQTVVKADKPTSADDGGGAFLFVPEYANGRVTADLNEQTVKPKAVYRLSIDTGKGNARFLARLLNSPYGRHARDAAGQGATIQRLSVSRLLSIGIPLPDLDTQERIARIDSDVGLLQAWFRDAQEGLDTDWTRLADVAETIDGLKAVVDIDRKVADWWRDLPYPLACWRSLKTDQGSAVLLAEN